jgi:hypothetical protein
VDGGGGRALGADGIITSDRENKRLITSDRQEQRSRIMGIACAPINGSCRERWIGASLPKDRGLSFDLTPAFDSSLGGNYRSPQDRQRGLERESVPEESSQQVVAHG